MRTKAVLPSISICSKSVDRLPVTRERSSQLRLKNYNSDLNAETCPAAPN